MHVCITIGHFRAFTLLCEASHVLHQRWEDVISIIHVFLIVSPNIFFLFFSQQQPNMSAVEIWSIVMQRKLAVKIKILL
jgi:hypothetical protein